MVYTEHGKQFMDPEPLEDRPFETDEEKAARIQKERAMAAGEHMERVFAPQDRKMAQLEDDDDAIARANEELRKTGDVVDDEDRESHKKAA